MRTLAVCTVALLVAIGLSVIFVGAGGEPDPVKQAAPFSPQQVAHGEYVFRLSGCANCHTDDENDGRFMAGGVPIETPFGVFYSPNITPETHTGIGTWSLGDFVRSMRLGIGPRGQRFAPVFPYTSYSSMRRDDIVALYAYLRTVPAVAMENREPDHAWYVNQLTLTVWQWLFFAAAEFREDPEQSAAWNRGAYIATAMTHCGECHTPRNALGALNTERWLAGTLEDEHTGAVPNITSSREHGIGGWSRDDLEYFLEDGMLPDGDYTGSVMAEVVDSAFLALHPADRQALLEYLRTVPPVSGP